MSNVVLVTGGAGYIGSHTCKALARAGFLPVTYDSLERGNRSAVKWGPLEVGNILDKNRLLEVLAKHRPVAAVHFAAYAYVGESIELPEIYYKNNVSGTITLLQALSEFEIEALVFSSTCSTFGNPLFTPIIEDHPQDPINPYGSSKLMVEKILNDLDAVGKIRSVSLRYFNAAGADPDGEIGELHTPETHLIPLALSAALNMNEEFRIFGTDYPTLDGTCVRDYVHVSDLADAHVMALEHLQNGESSCALNLGTGTGCSVRQILKIAMDLTGRQINIIESMRRPGDPPVLVAESAKAKKVLGWVPKYPKVETQMEHALKWMVKHKGTRGS